MSSPVVEFKRVSCRFGRLTAVNAVDLAICPGEVLALLGENGAGKSTLMKLLYGIHSASDGQVYLDGEPSPIKGPADAMARGVGMVFQHFSLLPALSVRDNLLTAWPNTPRWISPRNTATDAALKNLKQLAPGLNPDKPVADLSVGEQQLVELTKVMKIAARIVILDEPTSVLTPQETQNLYRFVRELADAGVAVVLITHKIADVKACADRIAIMRAGQLVDTVAHQEFSADRIVSLMMGQSQSNPPVYHLALPKKPVKKLQLVNVCAQAPGANLKDINLAISGGEIVALAGVAGNGQTLLAEAVAGVTPLTSGDVVLDGVSVARVSTRQTFCTPLGYIPEQPKDNGIVGELNLADNVNIRHFAGEAELNEDIKTLLLNFGVNPPEPERLAKTLSGGNAQKLVIARELGVPRPAVLACYPTMGLDYQSTERVYEQMIQQAKRGAAVLWISEDLDQILRSAHRIAVIREGALVAVLENDGKLTREALGALMTDASTGANAA
jgi:ABC-type uncharacterized transport system ATPase subunit